MLPLKSFCVYSLVYWLCVFLFFLAFIPDKETLVESKIKMPKRASSDHENKTPTFSEQEDLPDDPYMSYLFQPRLTFSGTYQSDVSTVNNIPSNYDTTNFVQSDYLLHGQLWNSRGSGEWNVNSAVTQVCYASGSCVSDLDENDVEPIVGAQFQEGGIKTTAKMVDLDTHAQLFSEIWGWRIRIGDFFSADYTPVPFQYIWGKVVNSGTMSSFGAAYQTVLSNISWIESKKSSPLIKEWREIMKNNNVDGDKLSIRFNVDMYELDPNKNNFTYGRLTGSIGLLGIKSAPFFSHGRMLRAQSVNSQDAPFIVDRKKRNIHIDLGNSLQVTSNGSFDTGLLGNLYVGIPINVKSSVTCSNEFLWLGEVFQRSSTWYRNSAGIQSFPTQGSLSERDMEIIKNTPLIVAEVTGIWPAITCKTIVLAEALDGVDVHPYSDWTLYMDPGETAEVKLIATKFGEPFPNEKVKFEPTDCVNIFSDGPKVGVPAMPPPEDALTDSDGIAIFALTTKDPKNPRGYIDGQLYPYAYSVEGQKENFTLMCNHSTFKLLNYLIVIGVWDQYGPFPSPTWLDHVYPIFKQYANLYPVMTENFVDLGNYYEVKQQRKAIKLSMELPISHPNHMPVTRDLSSSKREVILKWLSQDELEIGEPKDFYTVKNLRKDLQTALQLEQATIPPYLTALASIKYNYNADVQSIIKSIVIQEMMHMNLVANILNAVGGRPVLYSKDFVPFYPSRLPGGIQPDLVVPIEKVSIHLIRNVFMKIEEPGVTQEKSFDRIFKYIERRQCSRASKYTNEESCKIKNTIIDKPIDPGVDEEKYVCLDADFEKESKEDIKQRQFGSAKRRRTKSNLQKRGDKLHFPNDHFEYEKHHNTIGGFYNHILNTLGYLTNCGANNSIFTGDPARQVDFKNYSVHGQSLNVTDFYSAVEAIRLIVEQGEGSSPCNPMACSETGKNLSHYFLFYSVAEKRQIQVFGNKTQRDTSRNVLDTAVNFTELCNGTYFFTGPKIPFDAEGVWPMVSNPKMSKYKKGTKAYLRADKFNKVYTRLLKSLEHVFNGYPQDLKDALGMMYSVNLHLKNLVRTPIDPDGDPDVGPNAGPPFDFVP